MLNSCVLRIRADPANRIYRLNHFGHARKDTTRIFLLFIMSHTMLGMEILAVEYLKTSLEDTDNKGELRRNSRFFKTVQDR